MGIAQTVGELFGSAAKGALGATIDKALDIVSKVVTDKDLKETLSAQLNTLRATQAHDLEMAKIALEAKIEDDESALQIAQQATFQAEVNQADLVTKRTRPTIARRSFSLSTAYAIIAYLVPIWFIAHPPAMTGEQLDKILELIAFKWEVYLTIASPSLGYMGVRTVDLWKAGGAKRI